MLCLLCCCLNSIEWSLLTLRTTCCSFSAQQFTPPERGVKGVEDFKGVFSYAARQDGVDCAAGTADVQGKVGRRAGIGRGHCEQEGCSWVQ